jgi:hypothetical protein
MGPFNRRAGEQAHGAVGCPLRMPIVVLSWDPLEIKFRDGGETQPLEGRGGRSGLIRAERFACTAP